MPSSAQSLHQSAIVAAFSTFVESAAAAAAEKEAALLLLLDWLKTKKDLDTWTAAAAAAFTQAKLKAGLTSTDAAKLLTQFVQQSPPYQTSVFLQQYLLALQNSNCSPSTIKNYRSDISQFFNFANVKRLNQLLQKPVLLAFIKNQRKKGLKTSSIKRKLISIAQFGAWVEDQGIVAGVSLWLTPLSQAWPNEPPKTRKPNVANLSRQNLLNRLGKSATARKTQDFRARLGSALSSLKVSQPIPRRQLLPYLNLAMIVLFLLGAGIFGYQQFNRDVPTPLAYPTTLTRPNRDLSFQGRLTDTAYNPITSATNMQFKLYDNVTGGSLLWESGTCSITPDQDGIFTSNLGDDCGSEITDDVFTENANVWLEVTIAAETLDPRQPIKSVAYALNAETVQGYPASASAVENTVIVMDNSGQIVLGNATPVLKSTGASFAIEAQALTLQTTSGSNGDITLSPDGAGRVNINSDLALDGFLAAPGATLSANYAEGVALVLKGGPSGTGDIQQWQNSAGTVLSVVDSAGNVGIGSTDPAQALDVVGNAALTGDLAVNGGDITSTGSLTLTPTTNLNLNSTGDMTFDSSADIILDADGADVIFKDGGTALLNITNSSSDVVLQPQQTDKDLIFKEDGGTEIARLDSSAESLLIASSKKIEFADTGEFITSNGTDLTIASGNHIVLSPTANVGIGTTSPGGLLDIGGSSQFRVDSSGDLVKINNVAYTWPDLQAADSGYVLSNDGAGNLSWVDSGTGAGLWAIADNVFYPKEEYADVVDVMIGGIATASADIHLYSDGRAVFNEQGNDSDFRIESDTNVNAFFLQASDGNVGIGTSTPANLFSVGSGSPFQVNSSGAIAAATGVTSSGNIDLSSLAAGGMVKAAATTGRLSIASEGTDYEGPLTFTNGLTESSQTVKLGGSLIENTTLAAGNAYNLNLTSDLTAAARSTYPLIISQANNATYNNSVGLLQLNNQDTGSTASVLNITQAATSGTGISFTSLTGGTSISVANTTGTALNANTLTTGTGLTATALTTGAGLVAAIPNGATTASALRVTAAATAITADYTGAVIDVSPTRTLTAAATRNESGNYLKLARNAVTNGASSVYNLTGAVATLSSNCTQTAGTCTDSSNILSLAQSYANSTGTVLNVAGAGTGNLANLDASNASANGVSIDVQSSSSSQYALNVSSNNGATTGLYVRADGNVGIGTTGPSEVLQVIGNTRAYAFNATGSLAHYYAGGGVAMWGNTGSAYGSIQSYSDAGGTGRNLSLNQNGGNVGIGTTAPGSKLSINGGISAGSYSAIAAPSNGFIIDGNVGIGTTDPGSYKLNVAGTGYFGNNLTIANTYDLYSYGSQTLGNRTYTEDNYVTDAQTFTASVDALDQALYDVASGVGGLWLDGGASDYLYPNTAFSSNVYVDTGKLGVGYDPTTISGGVAAFNGNVGIGTTAPSQKLHVAGNAYITGALYDSSNSAGSSGNILTSTGSGTSWGSVSSVMDSTYFKQDGNSFGSLATLGTNDTYGLALETNGTERLRIDTSGNIGIGTTSPGSKLSVNGGISAGTYSGTAAPSNGMIISGNVGIGTTEPGDLLSIQGNSATNNAVKLTVKNTNSAGNAGATFYNDSTGYFQMRINGSAYSGPIWNNQAQFTSGGGAGMTFGTDFDVATGGLASINFRTGGYNLDPRVTITSTGNVGIGTTSPEAKLHVNDATVGGVSYDVGKIVGSEGIIRFGSDSDNNRMALFISHNDLPTAGRPVFNTNVIGDTYGRFGFDGTGKMLWGAGSTDFDTDLYRNAANVLRTSDSLIIDGNVGIGTTAPGSKLGVNGAVTIGSTYSGLAGPSNGLAIEGNVGIGTTSPQNTLAIDGNGVWIDNPGGIGKTQISVIESTAGNAYVRGSILMSRDGDVSWDGTYWDKTGGSSTEWAGILQRNGDISITTIPGGTSFTDMTNADFRNTYERLTISMNGNVGIGDTTPDAPLDVVGDVYISDGLSLYETAVSDGTVEATKFCTGDGETNCVTDFSAIVAGSVLWNNISSPTDNQSLTMGSYTSAWTYNSLSTQTGLTLSSTSTALTSGGLFNLSATGAPAASWTGDLAKIEYNNADADVDGSALKVGLLGTTALGSGTALNVTSSQTGAGALALRVNDDGTYTDSTPFVVDVAGNVGVGTTGPASILHISQTSAGALGPIAILQNPGTTTGTGSSLAFTLGTAGTSGNWIGQISAVSSLNQSDSYLAFSTRGSNAFGERVRIDNQGNVGIGTTSPATNLHIYDNNTDTAGALRIEQDGTGDASLAFLLPSTWWTLGGDQSDSDNFKISQAGALGTNDFLVITKASGNVGIGDTTPTYKLDVNGTGRFTGAVDFDGDIELNSTLTDINGSVGSAGEVLSSTGSGVDWVTLGSASITDDSLDYVDFEDTMDLDANLTLNQTTYTWSQTYTGTTGTGYTYTANSLTSGGAISVASSATGLTGDLVKIENTGNNAGVTGNALKVGLTGAAATGTALNVTTAGTSGYALRVNDDGTYTDSTPFVVDVAGNVGIGTTSASTYKFEVDGTANIDAGSYELDVLNTGLGVTSGGVYGGDNGTKAAVYHFGGVSADLRVGPSYVSDRDYIELQSGGSASALVTNNETLNITNTGGYIILSPSSNVGIGSTSPGTALDVVGTGRFSTGIDANAASTIHSLTLDGNTGTALNISGTSFGTDINLQNGETIDNDTNGIINFKDGSNSLAQFYDAGTVGNLFVTGGISTYDTTVTDGYVEASGICLGNGTNCITSWDSADGYWTLSGSNLYPDSTSYNVGVGTTSPGAKLFVQHTSISATAGNEYGIYSYLQDTGVVTTGTDNSYASYTGLSRTGATGGTINNFGQFIELVGDTGGTSTNYGLYVTATGADTNYSAIFDGGNVGIGSTSPGNKLDIDTNSNTSGIALDNRESLTGYSGDNWLRLNQSSEWASGVYTPGLMRADGGFNVDNTTAIDNVNRYHYSGNTSVNKWGAVNSSGFGIDALNSGDWDLLIYESQTYTSNLALGYVGTAVLSTYDTNEALYIRANGSGNINIMDSGTGDVAIDTNTLYIDNSANRVGIGTTGPSYKLDVSGTGRFTGAVDLDADLELNSTLTDINGSVGTSGQILSSTGTGVDWIDISSIGYDYWQIQGDTGGPTNVTDGYLVDFEGGEGIDTAFTANKLTISGEDATISNKGIASFSDSYFSVSSGAVSIDDIYLLNTGDTGTGAYTFSGGIFSVNASSNFATNINTGTSTGAVSIGGNLNTVAIDSSSWDINSAGVGSGFTQLTVDNLRLDGNTLSSTTGAVTLQPLSGQNLNVTLATTGDFAVNTNQLYVDTSAGNVGIGTVSPSSKFEVAGDIRLTGDIYKTGDLTIDSSTDLIFDADGADIYFKDGGITRGRIDLTPVSVTQDQSCESACNQAWYYTSNYLDSDIEYYGQSFTVGTGKEGALTKITLKLYRIGSDADATLVVELREWNVSTGKPGSVMATSTSKTFNSITTSSSGVDYEFTFSSPASVIANTKYAFNLRCTNCSGSDVALRYDNYPDNYSGGEQFSSWDSGSTWSVGTTEDLYFITYTGSPNDYGKLLMGRVDLVNADLAENYPTLDQTLSAGEIVIIDTQTGSICVETKEINTEYTIRCEKTKPAQVPFVAKTKGNSADRKLLLGVVSTKPGITLGGFAAKDFIHYKNVPVALAGRVPVTMSRSSQPVKSGDYITSSGEPGKGTKLIGAGFVVGRALENWSPSAQSDELLLFVETGWVDSTDDGLLLVSDYVFDANYNKLSLEALNSYLQQNKHLPGLLSSFDANAWGNISIQTSDMKLLEKIEENTLYVLENHQRLKNLEHLDLRNTDGYKLAKVDNQYQVTPVGSGSILDKALAVSSGLIGQLKAGLVDTQQLIVTGSGQIADLSVNTLKVSGQTIQDLISNAVTQEVRDQLATLPSSTPDLDLANPLAETSPTPSPSALLTPTPTVSLLGELLADSVQTATLSATNISSTNIKTDELSTNSLVADETRLGSLLATDASVSGELNVQGELSASSARIAALEAGMAQLDAVRANTAELVTATVSGTLYADNIDQLEEKIAAVLMNPSITDLLSGQATSTSNASVSASLSDLVQTVESAGFSATVAADLALTPAELGLTDQDTIISGKAAYIDRYFKVNGSAYVADALGVGRQLLVGEMLSIGSRVALTENYLAFATDPATELQLFQIQPSGKGTLALLGDLMVLDDSGQVIINGDAYIAGNVQVEDTLLADLLQPTDFGNPFQVQVAGLSADASGSATKKESRFEIVNELGAPVATISAQGKAHFAGGIGVDADNLGAPSSSASAELAASKTSGRATIPAGSSQLTINHPEISADSLIYVTPLGSTGNRVLYVKSQTPAQVLTTTNPDGSSSQSTTPGSFIVGFDSPAPQAVEFNWWIVN